MVFAGLPFCVARYVNRRDREIVLETVLLLKQFFQRVKAVYKRPNGQVLR
jgi:hypothetical protein